MQSESPSSDTHEIYNDYGAALEHDQIPIIYHDAVNIGFWGLEKLQPFDTKKYRRIRDTLARDFSLKLRQFPTTKRVPSHAELSLIHTSEYLEHIGTSYGVARVCEFPLISFFPYSMTHSKVVLPMKTAMAGTILASHFAMQRGWAINLGGGFHHSAPESASGWCMFGDIPYSWIVARSAYPQLQRAMYIDFDVHQGNGFERLWINDPSVYIVDAYNSQIFPGDTYAKRAIHQKLEFPSGIQDGPYLELISRGLEKAFQECQPDIIYYNAGTDILQGDPLGNCRISIQGVVARDEMVFRHALERKIPIVMVPSGGYSFNSAVSIIESIKNLRAKFKIF